MSRTNNKGSWQYILINVFKIAINSLFAFLNHLHPLDEKSSHSYDWISKVNREQNHGYAEPRQNAQNKIKHVTNIMWLNNHTLRLFMILSGNLFTSSPFKRQSHKPVKHNQTIRRQIADKLFEMFDHFVGLALKGLIFWWTKIWFLDLTKNF